MHMLLSARLGLLHAALVTPSACFRWRPAHWTFSLDGSTHDHRVRMLTMLPAMHPLGRERYVDSEAGCVEGVGWMALLGSLMAHSVFGLLTGAIYVAAAGQRAMASPSTAGDRPRFHRGGFRALRPYEHGATCTPTGAGGRVTRWPCLADRR